MTYTINIYINIYILYIYNIISWGIEQNWSTNGPRKTVFFLDLVLVSSLAKMRLVGKKKNVDLIKTKMEFEK